MSNESGQSEDTSTAEQQQAATGIEENGATQADSGATQVGEQTQTEEAEQGGQGSQKQSKSQNSKQRVRRKLRESEAEKAQLRDDNRKLTERLDTLESQVDGVINPRPARPTRVNFENEEDYEDALHDWRNPKKVTSEQQSTTSDQPAQTQTQQPGAQQQQTQVSAEVQKVVDDWHDSCDDAADKYEDFNDVVFDNKQLPITNMMRDALYECGQGGEVVYHLGKNPAEATRIAGLNLIGQVSAINELSKKFASSTTGAPEPIETIKSGDAGSGKTTDPVLEGAKFE